MRSWFAPWRRRGPPAVFFLRRTAGAVSFSPSASRTTNAAPAAEM
ncbi:hypothetical protein ACTWQR_07095 [Streptomyces sp. 2A115]